MYILHKAPRNVSKNITTNYSCGVLTVDECIGSNGANGFYKIIFLKVFQSRLKQNEKIWRTVVEVDHHKLANVYI